MKQVFFSGPDDYCLEVNSVAKNSSAHENGSGNIPAQTPGYLYKSGIKSIH